MSSYLPPNYSIEQFLYPMNEFYSSSYTDKKLLTIVEKAEQLAFGFLNNDVNIEPYVNKHLDEIFKLRIAAIIWSINNNPDEILDVFFDSLKTNERYVVLYENVQFAIRTNIRVIYSMFGSAPLDVNDDIEKSLNQLEQLSEVSFSGLINLLSISMPSEHISPITDFIINSLGIEFGIVVAFILGKKQIDLPEYKINELSIFVAKAARKFGANYRQLNPSAMKERKRDVVENKKVLEQEYLLAEQGIGELLNIEYDFAN